MQAALPLFLAPSFKKGEKGFRFRSNSVKNCRQVVNQVGHLGAGKTEAIDISHDMAKTPVFIKTVSRFSRNYRGPHQFNFGRHLAQQRLVPVFSFGFALVHAGGNQLKNPFQRRIEGMEIECHAIQVQIVAPFVWRAPSQQGYGQLLAESLRVLPESCRPGQGISCSHFDPLVLNSLTQGVSAIFSVN